MYASNKVILSNDEQIIVSELPTSVTSDKKISNLTQDVPNESPVTTDGINQEGQMAINLESKIAERFAKPTTIFIIAAS